MIALLIFLVFLFALMLSAPVSVSMLLGALAPIVSLEKGGSVVQLLYNVFSGANTTPLLAVPLFILSGVLMARGGISRRLFNFFAFFVGRFPGGVPCAAILTCLFYGAISGSGPAATAGVGAICIPFLTELGYEKKWCAGLIAVAGGLGVIIPPSIPFVLYSVSAGGSTGELFLGGILPGILIGLFLMIYTSFYCIKHGEDQELIDDHMQELRSRGFISLFADSFWALISPLIILGGIYSGFFTPTESATISIVYALVISLFVYHSIRPKELLSLLRDAVANYTPLLFVLAFSTAFSRVLALTRASDTIERFLLEHFHHAYLLLIILVIFFLLLGTVMDMAPAIIIIAPVLLPVIRELGISSVHFGVILVCCLSIGMATPPFGRDLFVAANIAQVEPREVSEYARPFMIAFLLALLLIVFVPAISSFLPSLL